MTRANPLASGAFRFALLIAAVFAIGSLLVLVLVERSVAQYAAEAANESLQSEMAVLRGEERAFGRAGLVAAIGRHEQAIAEQQLRYLLIGPDGQRLAGSLPTAAARPGVDEVTIEADPHDEGQAGGRVGMQLRKARLGDGAVLVVGNDTSDVRELRERLRLFTLGFGGVIILLALAGGLFVGTVFLRRLERVNRSIERIMSGDVAERLPTIGMSSEFDHLSTNLNRMLDRIEALMDGLRHISTDIAHDLRTPLTRLRYRLELMKGSGRAGSYHDNLDAALTQTDEILAIFRALLRIASLEAGSESRRLATVDLSAALEHVFQAYLPVAEDRQHALVAEITPEVEVEGDRELLTQAFSNLIENALLHTPPGSRVVVRLEDREDGVHAAIVDNGPGVSDDQRDKITARFYRLEVSRSTPGTGLGLALVGAIATLHRAALVLSDADPGLRVELIFPNRLRADPHRRPRGGGA